MVQKEKYPVDLFKHLEEFNRRLAQKEVFIFLDYDGTLTPIVATPDLAVLSEDMRDTVRKLAGYYTVSVVSGRATDDVQSKVRINGIFYAGSHGFEILCPDHSVKINEQAGAIRPVVDQVHARLSGQLSGVSGALVEHVKYTISVHYRLVADEDFKKVEDAVQEVLKEYPQLRRTHGKKVFELRPKIDWHKGKAVEWILNVMRFDSKKHAAIYVGDDVTDEDAFSALDQKGWGILVADPSRESEADFSIGNSQQVKKLLEHFIEMAEHKGIA